MHKVLRIHAEAVARKLLRSLESWARHSLRLAVHCWHILGLLVHREVDLLGGELLLLVEVEVLSGQLSRVQMGPCRLREVGVRPPIFPLRPPVLRCLFPALDELRRHRLRRLRLVVHHVGAALHLQLLLLLLLQHRLLHLLEILVLDRLRAAALNVVGRRRYLLRLHAQSQGVYEDRLGLPWLLGLSREVTVIPHLIRLLDGRWVLAVGLGDWRERVVSLVH
mmetsp:Transcript_9348/g.14158  ORF Transcript_9348/g.14158 Transcript_9348/m.14158 type:complete len:222 (-) Transcript_9348:1083-1748(-)